jgi:hypothetical protein
VLSAREYKESLYQTASVFVNEGSGRRMFRAEMNRSVGKLGAGSPEVRVIRNFGFGREEGRMWVFIRPGVVRSANEERLILGSTPVQFIVSMGTIRFWI